MDEINDMLTLVCKVHDLPLRQAWVECREDMACWALVNGGIFHVICYFNKVSYPFFPLVNDMHHLRKGQGVVGRALSPPNIFLCMDVIQLSITDYPLWLHRK
ncbi:unnamed protein product [Camellia sinensis]